MGKKKSKSPISLDFLNDNFVEKAADSLVPVVSEFLKRSSKTANDVIDRKASERAKYVNVPNVLDLTVDNAVNAFKKLPLVVETVEVQPDAKLGKSIPNTVLKISKKPESKVPPHTVIKLYFASEVTIKKSKDLKMTKDSQKILTSEKRKLKINQITSSTKKIASNLGKSKNSK